MLQIFYRKLCVCVCFAGPLSCKEVLCAVLAPVMEVGKDARSDDKDAPPLLMCQNQGPWNHSGFLRKIDLFRKEIGMGRNFEFHSHFNSQEVCGEQMLLINTSDQIITRSHDTTTTLRPGRCWKKGYREDMGRRPDSRVSKPPFKGLFGPPKMGRAFCWNSETPKTLAIDLVSREFHKFPYIDKFGLIGVFCIFWDAPHRNSHQGRPIRLHGRWSCSLGRQSLGATNRLFGDGVGWDSLSSPNPWLFAGYNGFILPSPSILECHFRVLNVAEA